MVGDSNTFILGMQMCFFRSRAIFRNRSKTKLTTQQQKQRYSFAIVMLSCKLCRSKGTGPDLDSAVVMLSANWARMNWVRISVPAPSQSVFLKAQLVVVRPLHPLLSYL